MALGLEGKKAIVAEVNEVAEGALSAVIADYRGVSVDEMTTLRKQARESNVYVRVVRNTLAKRAVVGTEFECMDEALVGPTILAFAHNEPGAAARLFKDFAKENNDFEIKAVSIGGKLLPADQIDTVAKLPTKDEAISMLMSLMIAPVTKLAQTFNEIPGKLVRTISAVKDKKESEAS